MIELDLDFNEDKEAKFIKEFYELWQESKKDILEIIKKVNKISDKKIDNNNQGYFG